MLDFGTWFEQIFASSPLALAAALAALFFVYRDGVAAGFVPPPVVFT